MHSPELALSINPIEQPDPQAFAETIAQDPSARYGFREEVGAINFGEIINTAVSYSQIAYNGLRATWAESRALKHQEKLNEKEHEARLYRHLEDLSTDLANEEPNLPLAPTFKKPLTREAASDERLQAYKAAKEKDPYTLPPKPAKPPVQNTISFDPALTPRTKKEREAMLKFAKQAHSVRDMRRSQERDIKMYGSAGEHSWRGTKDARFVDKVIAERDYEEGLIDAFGFREREQDRKAIQVTKTPEGMATRVHQLDSFAEKAPANYNKSASRAQKRAYKAQRKVQTAYNKAAERRQKQADARARLQ